LTGIADNYSRAVQINETVVTDIQKEKKRYEQREENMKVKKRFRIWVFTIIKAFILSVK
jgi:hypothetical protein